ncbi:MAG: DUF2252 family protein [Bacteroidetes bacterium]|nr:DUF2252 family protein [Bacteroidota bacterium]
MPAAIDKIIKYNKNISAGMLRLKWNALAESPFRFYRGTCHLFADDFDELYGYKSKIKTWMCGDLHFENFGSYKGENRLVYFDINDFDEAVLCSPEPELARFLTSIVIVGQQMKVAAKEIKHTLANAMHAYADTLHAGKAFMMEQEVAHSVLKKYFKQLQRRNREDFIMKHTVSKKGKLLLKCDGMHFLPVNDETRNNVYVSLNNLLKANKHFSDLEFNDVAFRIAGTGSLGLSRYCVLCYSKSKDKHYLIDIKEARVSCYKKNAIKQPSFDKEAERIIYAEWVMQFCPPAFLSAMLIDNKYFVVKELQPVIDKLSITKFNNDFKAFTAAALQMAPLIAFAHLRSSGYKGASTADDLIAFAGSKKWQKNILSLCSTLAERNNRYYHEFLSNRPK